MELRILIYMLLDIIAVYRLTKLVIEDEITAGIREKVFSRFPPETTEIGYLLTCPWCTSIWMAVAIFTLRKSSSEFADYVSSILSASAITGIAFSRGF